MSARTRRTLLGALCASAALLVTGRASAAWTDLNMPVGVTPLSRTVYDLHMLILWICVAIGVVVFGVMFYSIIKHRKSKGAQAAQFHESTKVEIVWTIIPFVILVAMAIPATTTLVAMEDTGDADLTINVTGYQWKWEYEYPEQDISFFSNLTTPKSELYGSDEKRSEYLLEVDNRLVVPTDTKIQLALTAGDVIHAWWVPDLGMKKDAIPGFVNKIWAKIEEPGVYRGQCAELCGRGHGYMPVVIEAKTPEDFEQWVESQKVAQADQGAAAEQKEWTESDLMSRGEKVYDRTCASCHQADGSGVPGTFPALDGGEITTGPVEDHIDIVMNGKPNTAMQAFGPQLSDADLAGVITYERNAWGNDTGDVVKPSDIKAAR